MVRGDEKDAAAVACLNYEEADLAASAAAYIASYTEK